MSPIPARATLYHYRTDEKTAGPVSKEVIDTLAAAGKRVSYGEIESTHGHDAFLMTDPPYVALMRAYLNRVAEELAA